MTEELFRDDAYLTTCDAVVVASGPDGIVLDRTVFYYNSGGQPGDSGVLAWDGGACAIADTRKDEAGTLRHLPAEGAPLPPPGTIVRAAIDWPRRHRHMRLHTTLHLISALVEGPITGAALTADKGRIDLDLPESPDKAALTARLQAIVAADHPVSARWLSPDDYAAAAASLVRTLNVAPPVGPRGVRVVEVAGIDLQPCGGTHVRSTAEIGAVRIAKIDKKGKFNRRIAVVFDDERQPEAGESVS